MNNQKNKNILSKSISSLFIIIFIILFIFLFTGYPYSIIYITIFCIGFLPLSIIYYVTIKIINKKKNRLEPNLIEHNSNRTSCLMDKRLQISEE
jgi:predicted membrane protein